MNHDLSETRLAVIGLGYVGLPLAVEFSKVFQTIGFDINERRVDELRRGIDATNELTSEELAAAGALSLSTSMTDLAAANFYVVTVPTPIDAAKRPDLGALRAASRTVGQVISRGDVVVFESTVYPGATEEVCIPEIEQASGLVFGTDFHAGYSPERINPGDRKHRLPDIVKVTSGSSPEIAEYVDAVYARIIRAGTHRASSIRVAEAAKVIENTQRDLNIALVNELAVIFDRMNIDTLEVLEAAGTKWNFLAFRPGLVGGHCIGVDPYYLTHKAQSEGYHPEVILAGRRINDQMGRYVADRFIRMMLQRRIHVAGSRLLVLGLTFKENCPDLRNTRVVDVIGELESYGATVDVHDPAADPEEAREEYGIELTAQLQRGAYDGVLLAVAHAEYQRWGTEEIRGLVREGGIVFDIKGALPREAVEGRL